MKPARVALLTALIVAPIAAQSGVSRWSSVHSFGVDRVDRGDLAVQFNIPVYNRNNGTPAQINLILKYNSQFWIAAGSSWQPSPGWGWQLLQSGGQVTVGSEITGTCGWYDPVTGEDDYNGAPDDASYDIYDNTYWLLEPDGSKVVDGDDYQYLVNLGGSHPRGWVNDCPSFSYGTQTEVVPDGKGYTIVIDSSGNATAWDSAGNEIDKGLTDINGNNAGNSTAGGVTTYSDPLGSALTVTGSGTPVSPLLYKYYGPNGSQSTITEDFGNETVTTDFGCTGYTEYPPGSTAALPIDLKFPDGSQYTFGYDSFGRLNAVTLPTGATINYNYTVDCSTHGFGNASLSRYDSINTSAHEWSWALTHPSGNIQTIETQPSPYSNDTVYLFNTAVVNTESGTVSQVDYYNGNHASGTDVETVTVSSTSGSGGITGQVTTTELNGTTPLYAVQTVDYDSYGGKTTETDTDWGTSTSGGSTLRTITDTYTGIGYGDFLADTATSLGGTNTSETAYGRDAYGNVNSQHDYTGASSYLSKSWTFNTNGTVATATDVNSGVTTYTYAGSGSGGCLDPHSNGLFPTTIQSPDTYVATSSTWNCTGGVPLTMTDANGGVTAITYADTDNTWRPTKVEDPAGNTTDLSYPSATQVERTLTAFNSGNSTNDVLTTLDGLGRTEFMQTRQAPGGSNWDTVLTQYDYMGRQSSVSMPYTATSPTSSGASYFTTTTYDELSRPTEVEDAGGGYTQYAYSMNDVYLTVGPVAGSENTKRKQEELDGLGRLASVCEITSGTGSGTCGQTNSQTGFWTTYTRNPAGQITAVKQNAQSASYETRSFSFDELGRMTQQTTPESGTTNFYFDTDATCSLTSDGDLVRKYDAAGNTTCFAYDSLHRVTGITYPSGPNSSATPAKTFVYDLATVDSTSMAKVKGRLAEAYTGSHSVDEGFSYTAAGQVSDVYQASPNSGGWYHVSEGYWPNGAPETLAVPGVPTISYGADGEGRSSTVSASSGQNPASAASYSALGLTSLTLGSGDSDAFTFDPGTGRMTQYQYTVNSQTDTGALSWNDNGSIAQVEVTDNITGTSDSQTCTYGHDDLGRLGSVNCGAGWSQTFTFDPFGNLAKSGTQAFGASYNLNNQISTDISFAPNYDSVGNLLDDPVTATRNVNAFDSDGHPVTLEGVSVTFDALGRAVEASHAGSTLELLYGTSGGKLAVMNGSTLVRADIPLPGAGEAVYNSSGLAFYRHPNQLGSSTLASTASKGLYSETAYAPYGEAYDQAGTTDLSFTGQKQDLAAGNYDFLMRVLNPIQGRWWTPDPSGLGAVDPASPQSWNAYAYLNGTPTEATDPLGLILVYKTKSQPGCPGNSDNPNCGPLQGGQGGPPESGPGNGNGPTCTEGIIVGGGFYRPDAGGCDGNAPGPGGGKGSGPDPTPPTSPPPSPPPPAIPIACEPTGNAMTPEQYAAQGAIDGAVNQFTSAPPVGLSIFAFARTTVDLLSFHRGGALDAQAQGGSPAYANYAFGVYMAAAGVPLATALAAANFYGSHFSTYSSKRVMDGEYPGIPADNVAAITDGFNDFTNGALCIPRS